MEIKIEDLIKERVEELDIPQMVRDEITRTISGQVTRLVTSELMKIAQEEAKNLVKQEIKNILSGEVVVTDSWSPTRKYDKFEFLFKEILKKECYDKYELGRLTKQTVEELAKKYVQDNLEEVKNIIKEQMTLRLTDEGKK